MAQPPGSSSDVVSHGTLKWQAEHLSLYYDHVARSWVLYSSATMEQTRLPSLPAGATSWQLSFADGLGFVYTDREEDDDSIWCQELFASAAYRYPDGEVVIIDEQGNKDCKDYRLQRHRLCVLGVRLPGLANLVDLDVASFDHARDGCKFWWALGSFMKHTLMANGESEGRKVSREYLKRWGAWDRFLAELDLPGGLMKSIPSGASGETHPHDPQRPLEQRTMATHVVLALLARSSLLPRHLGGATVAEHRMAARRLLAALVHMAKPRGLAVSVEPSWWTPTGLLFGDGVIVLSVSELDLSVDLQRLRRYLAVEPLPDALASIASTLSAHDGDSMGLVDFVEVVAMGLPRTRCLFGQVVWGIANALEALLAADQRLLELGESTTSALRWANGDGMSAIARERRLVAYSMASRRALDAAGWHLVSVALDASTVACFNRVNIAVGLPNNIAFWVPPQVPLGGLFASGRAVGVREHVPGRSRQAWGARPLGFEPRSGGWRRGGSAVGGFVSKQVCFGFPNGFGNCLLNKPGCVRLI